MLKIGLVGYGHMGKLIELMAVDNDCMVVSKIDPLLENTITASSVNICDVCIDFSLPNAVLENIKTAARFKKNIVIGTTGWLDKLDEVKKIVEDSQIGLIYSTNFSLGMNLFFQIVRESVKLISSCPEYDLYGYEIHHKNKLDSPSGTAKKISQIVLENIKSKKSVQYKKLDGRIADEEFHFASIRGGNIPGTHCLAFDSLADTIEIKHTVRNREGLALGALKAAHWIKGKVGLFEFSEVLPDILLSK